MPEPTVPAPAAPAAPAESPEPDDPGEVDRPTADTVSRARPAARGGDPSAGGDSTVSEIGRAGPDRPDAAPLVSERTLVTPTPLPGRYRVTGTAEADPYRAPDRDLPLPGYGPGPHPPWRPPPGPGGVAEPPVPTLAPTSGSGPPPGADVPTWSGPGTTGHPAGPGAVPGDRSGVTFAGGTPPNRPEPDEGDLDPMALDRLSRQLYGRLRGELAADLLIDRERAQLLTDLI